MIYLQCKHSVPIQEVVCPLYSEMESKSVEIGGDGCECGAIMQVTLCVHHRPTIIIHLFMEE